MAGKPMPGSIPAFEFATASRILFGEGERRKIGELAAQFGRQAFLVVGHLGEAARQLEQGLTGQGLETTIFQVKSEPSVETIRSATAQARQANCELVVGFGGGSAMDTAKAVAAMVSNPGDVTDYLEVIGKGQALQKPCLPVLAIPTTAGTGSEVTRNAVIGSPDKHVKVSLRSASMLPKVALVDPELTYSLPAEVTFSTGLDALTQLIEPFVSIFANPLTDSLCREGMLRARRALPSLADDLSDREARRDMALASLFGGLALANAKLGAVHGFAGTIGGMVPVPHGAICARLLPLVMEANVRALASRGLPDGLERYRQVAVLLTGDPQAQPLDGAAWAGALIERLNIPSLGSYGLPPAYIQVVVEKSERSSSMRGNPLQLSSNELTGILQRAM
jgi:alcohol dehydrogenase class IV